ncbi:MAG: sulfurtransferase TusA family protein [Fibromonadaceae bacterium]|jgi:TusA-related sulfurtransferase|nr:sulfurtransferase TusA family protein [Fibromonadaceae bacterium]
MSSLDLTAEYCPMTFVKIKVALHELSKGDILEVFLQGEESLENIPRAVKEGGDRILRIEKIKGEVHKIAIEKG